MSRPADWHVLDLDGDPTPGDPVEVRRLAWHARSVADDAEQAEYDVRGLAGDGAVTSWIGAAGEVFRGALDDFPAQLRKLADSYGQAADALGGWAGELDGAQDQADRALALGRQARARIDALTGQLAAARGSAESASAAVGRLEGGGEPPDPDQVRAATRNAQAAAGRVAALSGELSAAQGELDAARRLALDARELRERAAGRAGDRIHDASDAGIEPNSFWEDFKAAVATVWEVLVTVATVVAIVVAVIAIFVGGPLVWGILLAAGAVLLADSLMRYANGEGSLWEVGLNLLAIIPGGRLLTALGRVTGLARVGTRVAGAVRSGVAALGRGLSAAGASLRGAAASIRAGLGRLAARMGDETGAITLGFGADAGNASRLVPGGGLAAHEVAGGHALARHLGRSDADLLARIAANPSISGASTFSGRAVAERSVADFLAAKSSEIANWLSGTGGKLVLNGRASEVTGRYVAQGSTSVVDVSGVRAVLKRDPSMPGGYRIQTAFPIP